MSDSFWNEIYDPQGMRVQGHTPNSYLFCSECKGLGGHTHTCSKVTKEELAGLVTRAQKYEKWARERAEKMLNAVQKTYGKLAMIKHENNKLRRANERLRAALDHGVPYSDSYKKRLLECAAVDIGPRPGDLEYVYWLPNGGGLSAYDLRIIADELDERNKN